MSYGDWSLDEAVMSIKNAIIEQRESVTLSTEYSTKENKTYLASELKKLGFKVRTGFASVTVFDIQYTRPENF